MLSKSRNFIIGLLIIILLVILSEIYTSTMSYLWINVIDIGSYIWNKLWWLIIIIVVGLLLKSRK